MCRDALQMLKAGLAGTATTKLLDVLEAAFGVTEAEDEVPDIQPTPAEAEEVLPPSACCCTPHTKSLPHTVTYRFTFKCNI